ncbi:protein BCL9 homolog [Lutzomyia longipalpis]|nr:protein BCL9 homolog [Lutzomyia longipalpis]XP_055690418.1 protein BCL9 homolog [Lutzomyia longipalpis]
MLKEKREKGTTVGTPTSSPHEGAATPPNTPPTSCHSMMMIKEERGVKQEADQDTSGSPKKEVSGSPRPQLADKKNDSKEITEEMASQEQKTTSQPRTDTTNVTSESEPPFTSSIQPLVSNMMGKQSGGLEYMQQSSQIFVFSTSLANKGAESVLNGHFPSIIAYHCAQPGTKKILEKHPLKLGQFNRHTPWNLMGGGGGTFGQKAPPGCRPKNPGAMLEAQESLEGEPGDSSWPEGIKSELPDDLPNGNASLVQGVKVPDENLTPQQRQHREEQLAMIRKMHLMLFPEQSDGEPGEVPPDGEEKPCPDFLPCPNQPGPMPAPGGAYKSDWGRLPPRQRAHGPPPPYHQTPRSASVPIATHSPSPNSPQNLTSTLSLPSPRGGALASPSDSRHAPLRHLSAGQSPVASPAGARPLAQSSPATPSSAHLSPCPLPDDKLPGSPAKESPEKGAFFDISPEGGGPESMGAPFALPDDNIPLNPDTSTAPETTKVMPFDPISSLAQMSQQLTSTAPPFSAPGPQSTCSYGEMQHLREPEDAMMECQMHGMMVPQPDMGMHNPAYSKILPPTAGKPLSPKMVPGGVVHGPASGGFSGGQMPRMGAPAGRLCPPASMADSYNGASVQVRASAPNTIQYLPARPQMCPQMPRPPPSLEFLQRFANPMPHNGDMGGMDAGRGVRVRHETQGHMMNGVFGQMHEGLFQGPPMRHPAPPFGPGGGHDKMMEPPTSQPYVGPSTTDPNYAQQFHNFQQQLYATTTRSGGAQGPPAAPYFINK